jgi:hypothetical protein
VGWWGLPNIGRNFHDNVTGKRQRLPGCCAGLDNPASSIGLLTGTNRCTIAFQEACREDVDQRKSAVKNKWLEHRQPE